MCSLELKIEMYFLLIFHRFKIYDLLDNFWKESDIYWLYRNSGYSNLRPIIDVPRWKKPNRSSTLIRTLPVRSAKSQAGSNNPPTEPSLDPTLFLSHLGGFIYSACSFKKSRSRGITRFLDLYEYKRNREIISFLFHSKQANIVLPTIFTTPILSQDRKFWSFAPIKTLDYWYETSPSENQKNCWLCRG